MDTYLIMCTVRNHRVLEDYFDNALNHGFDLKRLHVVLVTEDFCDKNAMKRFLADQGVSGDVYDERDREKWFSDHKLSDFQSLIPRRSHAETSFGLLCMLTDNSSRHGFFIDDDTSPEPDFDFFGHHIANLNTNGATPTARSEDRWVNVLFQSFDQHRLYPRGFPFSKKGNTSLETTDIRTVMISQGLWTGIPDLDAVRTLEQGDLNGQSKTRLSPQHFPQSFAVAEANYCTVCSMNLAFRRDIIPFFYQLPMDDNDWHIGRFDDIWSGVIVKRILDARNEHIICGLPLCCHSKHPRSTFKDLSSEAPGLEINEHLYNIVDRVDVTDLNAMDAYREISKELENNTWNFVNGEFLNYMGRCMTQWTECVDRLSRQ